MFGMSFVTKQSGERPERILLIHIHEEQSGDLTHTLTVADLHVVHGVGRQHVEQRLLSENTTSYES